MYKTRLVKFKPGELVLIHLRTAGKPLVGKWQGPYPVKEQVSTQTYVIHTPDKRIKKRQLHVNSLRLWTSKEVETVGAGMVLGQTLGDLMDRPGPPTELEAKHDPTNYQMGNCIPSGHLPDLGHLTTAQQEDLEVLCRHYEGLLSGKLGMFKGVTHDVDVGDHPPIRQHFYRAPPEKLEIMKGKIKEMLNLPAK